MPQLLTREDLTKLFHCSLRHVDNLRTHQGLPWVQVGRQVHFLLEDVLEWLQERKTKALINQNEI
ncbi:MAG: helix-turn-helix domain-containing protein [Thermoguttaceae bacterium]